MDPFGIGRSLCAVQQAWLQHPGALQERLGDFAEHMLRIGDQTCAHFCGVGMGDPIEPVYYDERFSDPIWQENPFYDLLKEVYLLYTHKLEDAIYDTPDVSEKTRRKAAFWARQYLNAISPTNFFWTNPEAIWKFMATGGQSLQHGLELWRQDREADDIRMVDGSPFVVGENIAYTPGKVVHRNELLEVLQYTPTTGQVREIPIVIISPWINKYYILDLNEKKSLIRYLVDKGFTVFITSWKNVTEDMRDTGFGDYMFKGALEAIETARSICGVPQVHAVGYCIGGTMLSALMAWLSKGKAADMPVAHWTQFTTLVDFTEPGDIEVFVDEDSVAYLEKQMQERGYLDGRDMGTSFRMLRSNSLIWRYVVHSYLYGEEPPPLDVLYWNTDTTRLPARMHSEYLRHLYLENRLVQPNSLEFNGRKIDLRKVKQPLYAVGTEQDHIAPWKSTFEITRHVSGPVHYTLATSGHILGIVNPPVDPPKRRYWAGDATGQTDPEAWRDSIEKVPGSWWEHWSAWLDECCGEQVAPPGLGNKTHPVLCDAPGTYVLEK